MAFEEWEACWLAAEPRMPQFGVQAEHNVGSLINRMMMGNRVNIVGEGLVGQAAFTGDHLWVLSQYYAAETHQPEVQNELCHQFSSGMKTVAVIPVLNHGVVQLASYLTIMENMVFVNDVKSLIVQLGCVPGALLSDKYTSKESAPKIGVPVCLGKSVSADSGWCYMAKDSNPFVADSCNQQSISSQAFELVGQPSHSLIIPIEDNLQGTASKFQSPKLARNVVKSQNGLCQPSTASVIKPSIPFNSQHENGETGAGIIPSSLELWLNQQAPLFNSRSGFDGEHCVGSSLANSSNLRLMEEPILSDVVREHFNNCLRTSGAFITSQVRPNGGLNSSGQLHNGASSHPSSILNPCSLPTAHRSANHDFSCTYLTGGGPNVSNIEMPTSDLMHPLTSNRVLSENSTDQPRDVKCYQIEVAKRNEIVETDLFQADNISLANLGEHASLSETISGFRHDDQKHDYGNQSPRSQNVKYKDKYVQSSSGDDLFDILGVDFKNKIFSESCSNSLNDGLDINADTLGKKNYTPLNLQNADSDLYSGNRGNSDSGIFTATGTDHLLDAVVNRVHSAAKHSLDDTVSCRTTLTKISSSSIANASPSYGRGIVPDKMQDDLFELPKSLAKLGALGSCSFKSECSKEDAGNGQLHNGASSHPSSILNPCSLPTAHRSANHDFSCTYLTGGGPNVSNIEMPTSDLMHPLTSNRVLSENSTDQPRDVKCYQIEVAKRNEIVETDLFQADNISLANLGEHASLSETISGFRHDDQKHDYGNQSPRSQNVKYKDKYVQSSSGDDLFDILGVDFKNKIFSESCSNSLNDGLDINADTLGKKNYTPLNLQNADSDLYSGNRGNSDSGIFTATGTDHLLDAVVNRVHSAAKHSLDDTVSCRTTLTKISSSSIANASPSYGRGIVPDKMQDDLFELPKSLAKLGALGSCSFKSECSKEDAGNYSQSSSIYGSQISSWVEQGHSNKHNSSASTAYSKRADEVSKSSRKRLKPGENPRPRPKDRQMIQDRMKELRDIVPNGAKCSIDALLERTIKHMLFLQSVTKHADQLKQTGESKIISKDGGLLLKESFEGGRTWAYEVGSQSTVCPIIVEDLNPPRQMLVEMLCEERGLFLEIADIIRGLGLTILQGVMETRNDKIWARFAVEANRDVTRVEIFISLVHLLDQTVKSSAASGNGIENDNTMPHHPLRPAASLPATGRLSSLQ
ncbi:Transcription factor LHW like [Actinidia chinensis var. chinensis]|uniref:Transcription factor LHW like n=1 Tax=Actinidia chinensis var. chinensis TaxID=1590841 RepID=A0A2R6P748_ACTCC|nr:Transcription factor LHW like [Actinidia chinensis var. chinensis]